MEEWENWIVGYSIEIPMRDPFLIQGVLEGCTYPLDSLSIAHFRTMLGDLYEVYAYCVCSNDEWCECDMKSHIVDKMSSIIIIIIIIIWMNSLISS